MVTTRALVFAAALSSAAALRARGAEDPDHLVHEAVDHADHGESPKPTTPHQKDFVSLDVDGSGTLDGQELMHRQFATGCEPSEAQIRANDYMICGDADGNKEINPEEFEAALKEEWLKCVNGRSDRRAHGFMRFIDGDLDFDDKLSLTELRLAMEKLWGEPGTQLAKPFMLCSDGDRDGAISQEEFHDTIAVYNPVARKFQGPNTKVLTCLDAAMANFDAHLAFAATDTNKDGRVSRGEAFQIMSDMRGTIQRKTADAMFDAADTNKDGFLSLEEFKKAGESYKGEGESFFLVGARAPAPLAAGAAARGMGAMCAARPEVDWAFFSEAKAANATTARNK